MLVRVEAFRGFPATQGGDIDMKRLISLPVSLVSISVLIPIVWVDMADLMGPGAARLVVAARSAADGSRSACARAARDGTG